MADPFGALDAECGELSLSQDSDLLRFPFVFDGETPSPSSSDDSVSLPPADAPILFYSPPNSPIATDAKATATTSDADVATNADAADAAITVDVTDAATTTAGIADSATAVYVADVVTADVAITVDCAAAVATTAGMADSATAVDVADVVAAADPAVPDLGFPPSPPPTSPKETVTDHPPNRFKRRSRGPKLRSPDPEEEVDDKYRYQSLEVLKDVLERRSGGRSADGRRKLPSSFVDRIMEEDARGKHRRRVNFPKDLPDLVKYFSSKCDKRFANTDILDIAKMKGMEFPPVKWWRPGGYEAKDKEPADEEPRA